MEEKSPTKNNELYLFGPFRLDAGERLLFRKDRSIRLPRKVFDLLLVLVASEGRLKTREALIESLWPNTIVDEQGLATKMYALRKVLGDNGKKPKYIETVRGVGYRFIAPVTIRSVDEHGLLINEQSHISHSQWIRIGILAVFLVVIFVVGTLTWNLVLHPVANKASTLSSPAIAVLPFENLSRDASNSYFVSGIQDEILTRLAAINSLKVISRTSTAKYPSKPEDLHAIAQQLGVSAILEGSVQKIDDKVHINVQLINAHTYAHIWAHSYNRRLDDVFNVEGNVAQRIADALRAKLLPAEAARLARPPTANPQAYLDFLKANYLADKVYENGSATNPSSSCTQAIMLYERALQLDPKFALAYARLSLLEINAYWFIEYTPQTLIAKADKAARKALSLDPNLAEAHLAMGYISYYGHNDYTAALAQFEKAHNILPYNADITAAIAYVHRRQGLWNKALAEMLQTTSIDPRNPRRHYETAVTLTEMRRYTKALEQLDQALALEPDDYTAIAYKIRVLFLSGKITLAHRLLASIPPGVDPQGYFAALRFADAWFSGNPKDALAAVSGAPTWLHDAISYFRLPASLLRARAWVLNKNMVRARKSFHATVTMLQNLLRKDPENSVLLGSLGLADAELGLDNQAIKDGESGADIVSVANDAYAGSEQLGALARIYAITGHKTKALRLLGKLLSIPAGQTISVPLLRIEPTWNPLRQDPRFKALLKKYATLMSVSPPVPVTLPKSGN